MPSPPATPEQVGSVGHGGFGQGGDVLVVVRVEQDDPGSQRLGLLLEGELLDLAAAGARVEQKEGTLRRWRAVLLDPYRAQARAAQGVAAAPDRGAPQQQGREDHPEQIRRREEGDDGDGGDDGQHGRRHTCRSSAGQDPPERGRGQGESHQAGQEQQQSFQTAGDEGQQRRQGYRGQGSSGRPSLPAVIPLAHRRSHHVPPLEDRRGLTLRPRPAVQHGARRRIGSAPAIPDGSPADEHVRREDPSGRSHR